MYAIQLARRLRLHSGVMRGRRCAYHLDLISGKSLLNALMTLLSTQQNWRL